MTNNCNRSEDRFYVYLHIDPDERCQIKHPIIENKVVYVGMGQGARAWTFGHSGSDKLYGHRKAEHWEWFVEKEYTRSIEDLVFIYSNLMTREQATMEERETILTFDPLFNKKQGLSLLKMTEDKYRAALEMRADGLSYDSIGRELNLSTMTVYRALNQQTKNIGVDYGQ